MKPPQAPPDFRRFQERGFEVMGRIVPLILTDLKLTVDGRYLHWHKLRFHQPPEGFTAEEWWFAIRQKRKGAAKPTPLQTQSGQTFTYNSVDPIPERLHHIDSSARGSIGISEAVTNSETKNRYLIRSLIEESITSSQLEGASTTREVAKEMIRQGRLPRDRSERMIFNNYRTMQRIGELKDQPLTKQLVFEIHRLVTSDTLDKPDGAGRFRRVSENIVVGVEDGQDLHVPPNAETLPARMAEMCQFANATTPDEFVHPVLRAIILHFWLAYDHPFIDGNGRTARALFYWSMLRQGYWLFEYISISEIILKAPIKYGKAFLYTETDEEDLTYFLLYHTEVIARAMDRLNEHIQRKTEEVRRLSVSLRGMSALNHRQRALISHALRHPGHQYTVQSHQVSHNVVSQTARTDLLKLAKLRLLRVDKRLKALRFFPTDDLEERLKAQS